MIKKYRQRAPVGRHDHPTYAAMVESLDTGIGRVLKALDDFQLSQNTLVIFYSDNGGVGGYREAGISGGKNITSQAPLRGGKGMLYEGGIRVPMFARWPGVIRAGTICTTPIITVDFLSFMSTHSVDQISAKRHVFKLFLKKTNFFREKASRFAPFLHLLI